MGFGDVGKALDSAVSRIGGLANAEPSVTETILADVSDAVSKHLRRAGKREQDVIRINARVIDAVKNALGGAPERDGK